jgi:hypothetical protein
VQIPILGSHLLAGLIARSATLDGAVFADSGRTDQNAHGSPSFLLPLEGKQVFVSILMETIWQKDAKNPVSAVFFG